MSKSQYQKFDPSNQGFPSVTHYAGVNWVDGNSTSTNVGEIPSINANNLNKSELAIRYVIGDSNDISRSSLLEKIIDKQSEINTGLQNSDISINNTLTDHINHKVDPNNTEQENPHGITKTTIGLGNVENKSVETIHDELTAKKIEDSSLLFINQDLAYGTFFEQLVNDNINTHQTISVVKGKIVNDVETPIFKPVNIDLKIVNTAPENYNYDSDHTFTSETSETITSVNFDVANGKFIINATPIDIVTDQISNIQKLKHTTDGVGNTITSIDYVDGNFEVSSEPIQITTEQVTDLVSDLTGSLESEKSDNSLFPNISTLSSTFNSLNSTSIVGKTLTAITYDKGKFSTTFSDINIQKSQVEDLVTDLSSINGTLESHESRIDDIEQAQNPDNVVQYDDDFEIFCGNSIDMID